MTYDLFVIVMIFVTCTLAAIFCGIGSAVAGGGFCLGFLVWFLPASLSQAIKAQGEATRRAIQMAGTTSSLSGNIKIPQEPPRPHRQLPTLPRRGYRHPRPGHV